jgi:hypothetical protein
VESDRPLVFESRTYQWTQVVTLVAGRDTTVDLTAANARVGAAAATPVTTDAALLRPVEKATSILTTWQASAFELWTPELHAAGFLADAAGLVATSLRAIGEATEFEVQISPSVKVPGAVVVTDPASDIAVLRVHPSVVSAITPIPLACDPASAPPDAARYVIDAPMFALKDINSSLLARAGAAGGPVFDGTGRAIGLSSPREVGGYPGGNTDVRVVGAESVCAAVASARAKVAAAAPPDATQLPVEASRRPPGALAVAGTLNIDSYQIASSDFAITFLTPSLIATAEAKRDWTGARANDWSGLRVALDFDNWSAYVSGAPPLLFVRATPRLVEGFWMKVARGAASVQGAALPPIKRLRPGFSRLRLLCGGQEVLPIHPFHIRARVTESEAIEEGFYVFDPAAIGPHCGTVSVVLSSVKDPSRTETRVVDRAVVNRVWEDFATFR